MGYEVFEELCKLNRKTPADVSRSTGIAQSTLSAWKKGKYTPKSEKLEKIAEYFGVPVEYLKTGEMPPDSGYYISPEVAEIAQAVFDNPEMRILFDAARDCRPEDIKIAIDMFKRFKETNLNG